MINREKCIIDVSNLSIEDAENVIDELYKSLDFYCPICKSTNIKRKFIVPVSNYGHLPKPPVDLCNDCGFNSEESFSTINFRVKRDYKIEQILEKDGI